MKTRFFFVILLLSAHFFSKGQSCITFFDCNCPCNLTVLNPNFTGTVNVGDPIVFNFVGSVCVSDIISFGDGCGDVVDNANNMTGFKISGQGRAVPGSVLLQTYITYSYTTCGNFLVQSSFPGLSGIACSIPVTVVCPTVNNVPPLTCQSAFAPTPGDYIVSFWVKEDPVSLNSLSSYASGIDVSLTDINAVVTNTSVYANGGFNAQNRIIDGWQKVEQKITIPANTTDINITLTSNAPLGANAYFDDVRFQPFNSSLKSYVYDPVTLRLAAELDERNYATFYEYDEEGQLIRVKKETERGIKTIKESRSSVSK